MQQAITGFAVVFFIQLLLFIFHAYQNKKLVSAPRFLIQGAVSGLVIGLLLDFIFGKWLSLFSYVLGFGWIFLTINAGLLYGLFAANVLLMQEVRFAAFCSWMLLVGAVFEVINLFFPMWTWAFPLLSAKFLIVFIAGNIGTAILLALIWHALFGKKFLIFKSA